MGAATLTGREAAEALGLYARLGAVGASFDRRRVAVAVATRRGRLRLTAALATAIRRPLLRRRARGTTRRFRAAPARTRSKGFSQTRERPRRTTRTGSPQGQSASYAPEQEAF